MKFDEWVNSVSKEIQGDAVWRVKAYRIALFLSHLVWEDATVLAKDIRTAKVSAQLMRSVGSIGANIAEGFSRNSRRDQARLYEYALGSAREARHWYYQAQGLLGAEIVEHRWRVLTAIIQLLLTMIPTQRDTHNTHTIREVRIPYKLLSDDEIHEINRVDVPDCDV